LGLKPDIKTICCLRPKMIEIERSFCAQAINRKTLDASVEKWWPLPTTSLLAILLD
jgi:hypothetical protein